MSTVRQYDALPDWLWDHVAIAAVRDAGNDIAAGRPEPDHATALRRAAQDLDGYHSREQADDIVSDYMRHYRIARRELTDHVRGMVAAYEHRHGGAR